MAGDRRGRRGFWILMAVLLGIATWATATSPLFDVRHVLVDGERRLAERDVIRLSGIRVGSNILRVSAGRVERSLRSSPWVQSASVVRRLPSTVAIEVVERFPVATVRDDAAIAVLDARGTVLERLRDRPPDLVSLGTVTGRLRVGSPSRVPAPALRVVASLTPSLRDVVTRVTADGGQVTMRLRGGGVVRYGDADDIEAKNAALTSLLRVVAEEGIAVEYIDVRAPASPVIRPVTPSSAQRSPSAKS